MILIGAPVENRINITFDDQKTDEQKIARALVNGGLVVRTSPEPVR